MKTTTFLFFVAILTACDTATSTVTLPPEGLPAGAEVVPFDDAPGLGEVSVSNGGIKQQEGTVEDGLKEGVWVEYYPSGKVKSLTPYLHGKKEGLYVELGENGQVNVQAKYHNDQRHGDYFEYNYGSIKEERHYANGSLEGALKKYYDGGSKIMEESNYKNGTMDGVAKWYDQEGNVTIQYEYENGKLIKK